MIDIHMHLVPGVDDGARDLTMALRLAELARGEGIAAIVATPHSSAFDWSERRTREAFELLRGELSARMPDMPLFLGCEVLCTAREMGDVRSKLRDGVYPSLNGTRYVLAEFYPWIEPGEARRCAEALLADGWTPVLAHAERYWRLSEECGQIGELRALGCRVQINAYSLCGERDDGIRDSARRLAREGWADFLGTDAHRLDHRPPNARAGLNWLYENCGAACAHRLAQGNARLLLLQPRKPFPKAAPPEDDDAAIENVSR